jgi:hypothetical protein
VIEVAYYVGLLFFAALVHLPGYLPEEEESASVPLSLAAFLYLWVGGWLLGWQLGLANIPIFVVLANAVDLPLERLVRRFFPDAKYRMSMKPKTLRKLARIGRKLGVNKGPRG